MMGLITGISLSSSSSTSKSNTSFDVITDTCIHFVDDENDDYPAKEADADGSSSFFRAPLTAAATSQSSSSQSRVETAAEKSSIATTRKATAIAYEEKNENNNNSNNNWRRRNRMNHAINPLLLMMRDSSVAAKLIMSSMVGSDDGGRETATTITQQQSSSSLFLVATLIIIVSCLLLLRRRVKRKEKDAEEEPPWPVVPGGVSFVGNRVKGGYENVFETFEEWAELYGKEHGVYVCHMGMNKLIVLCSNDKLKQVERYRPFTVRRRRSVSRALASVNANGVFTAEGSVWQKERKIVGPALNRKNVRDYVTIAKLVASRLVAKWEQQSACSSTATAKNEKEGKQQQQEEGDRESSNAPGIVTINDDCLACTIDIISFVAFAKDIDTLRKGEEHRVGEDIKLIFKKSMGRVFSPIPYWKIPIVGQYLDGTGWAIQRSIKKMKQVIAEHEEVVSQHEEEGHEQEDDKHNKISDRTKSFLGKIITLSKKEEIFMTESRIIGNLLTMFSAGSETTYNVLIVGLYEIAIDKSGLQQELYEEITALFGTDENNRNDDVKYDDLQTKLPRMRSLMYEVLRMKGPTPVLGSESVDKVMIDGYELPPHSQFIMLGRYASSIDEKHVPKGPLNSPVNIFCPRRYLLIEEEEEGEHDDEEEKNIIQSSSASTMTTDAGRRRTVVRVANRPTFKDGFRSFGSSLRVCPGRDLAEMEILVLISYVLQRFEISLKDNHPPLRFVTRIAQTPDSDVELVLRPRRKMNEINKTDTEATDGR